MSSEARALAIQRPRKIRSDSVENRERVLAAARAVFGEAGLDALIPEIAARAGVGKGTVYRHFPSKEALMQALLDDLWLHLDTLRLRALAGHDPWEGFASLIEGTITIKTGEQRVACEILMATKAQRPHRDPAFIRIEEALVVLYRRAQEAGSAQVDVPAETMPLVLRSLGASVHAGREMDLDWQPYVRAVLNGLRAGEPQPR